MSELNSEPTIFEGTPDEIASFINELPPKRYHIEVTGIDTNTPVRDFLDDAVRRAKSRTREQMLADRADVLAGSRKAMPLPPGKTLLDMVVGQWPGDETDEQIRAALDELS